MSKTGRVTRATMMRESIVHIPAEVQEHIFDILDLPAELQEHIFDYLTMVDLSNLCSTNKRYYRYIQHLLWREIEIPWKSIQKESVLPKNLDRLKLTKHINFSDKDDGNGFVVSPSKWIHVSSGFKKLLKTCNRNKLISVRVCGLVADNGVKTMCTLLHHLKELCLRGCQYTTIAAWKTISTCKSLRKLTVEDCRIFNIGVRTICESTVLTDLTISRCQLITDPCVESIEKMRQLRKLALTSNRNITRKGMQCLGQHRNLNRLCMEYSELDADNNSCLCQLTIALEHVAGKGAQLVVTGCYEFTPTLSVDGTEITGDVSEDKLPRPVLEHFRKMKEVEEDMMSEDLHMNVEKELKDGKCKVNWRSVSPL